MTVLVEEMIQLTTEEILWLMRLTETGAFLWWEAA
jgi:hypothetical protein